jgi:hypothetical protein
MDGLVILTQLPFALSRHLLSVEMSVYPTTEFIAAVLLRMSHNRSPLYSADSDISS